MSNSLEILHRSGALYVFAFAMGACVGSFLNVFIYRWPLEESVWKPSRSYCPSCKTPIPWYLNVPIASWLMLRGRCKWCGQRISARYLIVELLTGIWFMAALWKFGPGLACLALFGFGAALLAASAIDLAEYLLPDAITLGLIPLGLAMAFGRAKLAPDWPVSGWEAALGAAAGAGLFAVVLVSFQVLTKREGMGWGDVKLMGALGAFLGYALLPAILIGGLAGVGAWVTLKITRSVDRDFPVPFGPMLSFGAIVAFMFREWMEKHWLIVDWKMIFPFLP